MDEDKNALQALREIWATTQECSYSTMDSAKDAMRDSIALIHIAGIVAPFILRANRKD